MRVPILKVSRKTAKAQERTLRLPPLRETFCLRAWRETFRYFRHSPPIFLSPIFLSPSLLLRCTGGPADVQGCRAERFGPRKAGIFCDSTILATACTKTWPKKRRQSASRCGRRSSEQQAARKQFAVADLQTADGCRRRRAAAARRRVSTVHGSRRRLLPRAGPNETCASGRGPSRFCARRLISHGPRHRGRPAASTKSASLPTLAAATSAAPTSIALASIARASDKLSASELAIELPIELTAECLHGAAAQLPPPVAAAAAAHRVSPAKACSRRQSTPTLRGTGAPKY